nr:conserved hypothetical chloroplast protein Ycf1 [Actinostachys digitata]
MNPSSLFGFYYGLLSTLPIGPSQIFCLRSFLLWGNLNGIIALVGSMTGQLLVFSSVFFSPIYLLIPRPNLVTLVVLPYVFLLWFRTKDLPEYQNLCHAQSIHELKVASTFPNSLVLESFNPTLLPNATLARLPHLVMFCRSNSITCLTSSFSGWLVGHLLLGQLSRLSIYCIEKDSPILYISSKRVIYTTFSIVLFIAMLLYPGRSPVPFVTRKFENELIKYDKTCMDLPYSTKWLCDPWPTLFFDPRRVNRPMRYRSMSRISNQSDIKKRVSTCFFTECVIDSKLRLVFASSPSLSIFEEQLRKSLEGFDVSLSNLYFYQKWIRDHLNKKENLYNELKDRIQLLTDGCVFARAMGKKTRLKIEGGIEIPRIYDPSTSQLQRARVPNSRSFLAICEAAMPILETKEKFAGLINRENKIKTWILDKHQNFVNNKNPLPWEPLSSEAPEIYEFVFDRLIPNEQKLDSLELRNILEAINNFQSSITWEDIFKLLPTDRALFFIYFEDMCRNPICVFLPDASSTSQKKVPFMRDCRGEIRLTHRIEDLERNLFRHTQFINDSRFDIPGIDSDIRNKKLRNLAINFGKTGLRSAKLLKRYSKSSDFRRRLIKGSMRKKKSTNQLVKPEVSFNDIDVNQLKMERLQFSYLTAWGFQTDVPFGTIKKDPSFWNPIKRRIVKTVKKNTLSRLRRVSHLINNLIESMQFGRTILNSFITVEGIEITDKTSNVEGRGLTNVSSKIKKNGALAGRDAINEEAEIKLNSISSNIQSVFTDTKFLTGCLDDKFKLDTQSKISSLFGNATNGEPIGNDRGELQKHIEKMDIQELRNTSIGGSFRSEIEFLTIRQKLLEFCTWVAKPNNNCVFSTIKLMSKLLFQINAYSEIVSEASKAHLVRTVSDITQIREKREQSKLDVSNQRAALLGINSDGSTGFLSQAYVFDRVWFISLKDRINLTFFGRNKVRDKSFDRSASNISHCEAKYFGDVPARNLSNYSYFDEITKKYIRDWGFLKSISALNINDWKIWLDCLDCYNLPIETWSQISPKKWKNFLDKKEKSKWVNAGVPKEKTNYWFKNRTENHSIYSENFLLKDRITNLGKQRECGNLIQSFADFVRDADLQKFATRQNAIRLGIRSINRLRKIAEERIKGLIICPSIFNSKMKWNLKLDLAPQMIVPNLAEAYRKETNFIPPSKSVPIDAYETLSGDGSRDDFGVAPPLNKFLNGKSEVRKRRFATRQSFRPKRRWKFRPKLLERNSDKLRELASIIHVMGNHEAILASTEDTDLEPDLLNLILDRSKSNFLNHLFFNAYTRRTKVLNDQILMHEMISTLPKFRKNFREVFGKKKFDEFLLCLTKKERDKEEIHPIFYNIEDLLFSRCRRQLRFLESFSISSYTDFSNSVSDFVTVETTRIKGYENLIKVQQVKRLFGSTHRLEDLACVNRFCFGATDGSRSTTFRMKMYLDT